MKHEKLTSEGTSFESATVTDHEARVSQAVMDRLTFDSFRRNSEEARAQQFVQEIAPALNPQYSWVADIEPSLLRNTFATIAEVRRQLNASSEKEISDWYIYRHFRLAVETENPSDQDMHTVLLLEALMDGDVRNGTLPSFPVLFQ